MSKSFLKILEKHEKADKVYVQDKSLILQRMEEEFENAAEFIAHSAAETCPSFFDYSVERPFEYAVTPVRKSASLYVKKHTTAMKPYYHSHSFYELIYAAKGKCLQFLYPGGEANPIKEGYACIVPPSFTHALAKSTDNDVILKFVIPCKYINREPEIAELLAGKGITVFPVSEKAAFYLCALAEECESRRSETAAKALLWLALTELAGKSAAEPDDSAERFADYVRDNIADATLNGCAAYFGYSPGHISKILKSRTGKSFSQNITEYRLDKAKSLLKDIDLSIEEISLQIGFANASGFYKQFTAAFGLTPGQYRKAVK